MKNSILLFIGIFTALTLGLGTALAQVTLPTPTSPNFDNNGGGGDGQWETSSNWDTNGIPTNVDDAKINDGLTATYDATVSGGAIAFGTLTIGVGSTFTYDPVGGSGTDFTDGNDIYFANNSELTVNGFFNSSLDLKVPSGSSAIIDHNGQSRYRGTLEGAGNLEFQIDNWWATRWDAGSFTGSITFSGSGYLREFGSFATTPHLGQGTNTIGTNIHIEQSRSQIIPDNATVVLVGAANGNDEKWKFADAKNETIANLIIQSPIAASTAPYILVWNSFLKVTNSVNFTGTAATNISIHSQYGPESLYPGEFDARGAEVTFGGSGDWALTSANIIFWVNSSSTINTINNATISGRVDGGFTKSGAGTLTIGDLAIDGGIIVNEGDIVCTTNVTFTASDYVELSGADVSFSADYGGSFTNIGDVNAAIGPTGYFRPRGAAVDNGTSFTVIPPPSGTLVIIK